MASKLDLTKEFKSYYQSAKKPELAEFGELPYITIEGQGAPGGEEFVQKVGALYPLAYGVKKICKQRGSDFGVAKLEGLWWVDKGSSVLEVDRSDWRWKLLIRMPDFVTDSYVWLARDEVIKKKGIELVNDVRFERIIEGQMVQIMHIGPYSTETESITKMRDFMSEQKLVDNGYHHEIYLSDPQKSAPEKLKTILRQPVKKK